MKAHIVSFCLAALSVVSVGVFAQDLSASDATALVKAELTKARDAKAPVAGTCTFAVCVARSDKPPVVILGRPFPIKDGEIDYSDKSAGMLFRGSARRAEDNRHLLQGDLSIIILALLPRMADVPPPTIKLHVNIALPPGTLTLISGTADTTVIHATGERRQQSTYVFCQND